MRVHKNNILGLNVNGKWEEELKIMRKKIYEYYKRLFVSEA